MRNSLKLDGPVKTYLDENELPKAWYNVRADMKKKPAPLLKREWSDLQKQSQKDGKQIYKQS